MYGISSSSSSSRNYFRLLDLNDEIIALIGYHLNGDSSLAITSYRPLWENTKNEIGSDRSRDLRNFRTACRRIRDVCKLRNLHVIIRELKSTVPRNGKPRGIRGYEMLDKDAISRVCILLYGYLPDQKYASSVYDEMNAISHSLPNLKELVVDRVAKCHHQEEKVEDKKSISGILSKYEGLFPNMVSLSIGISCADCANDLLLHIELRSPHLRHLRCHLQDQEFPEDAQAGDVTRSIVQTFREPFDQWFQNYRQDHLPLRNLCLRYAVFRALFPKLESLSVAQSREASHEMGFRFLITSRTILDAIDGNEDSADLEEIYLMDYIGSAEGGGPKYILS
ncbi:hypothetical protein I204_01352 [Kwoniella mangroviensis CBS 8886]|uniref:uncharacterized protein n=1 Tax=Kwoniella mangroviensis CBS 8507 TaxID=1296122 RepID=UPI00080CCC29|nr:uncharacterized protein I203_06082 [Kwoniella mangroviensis CBS 8507]OCF64838.1 hypothetical protein I203_06082 [Kwoniella mangroviensis CBS 8507]OCF77364.1 hypothetical protein I204_01352 [Kwoniella mangroviensis CBS 8886]